MGVHQVVPGGARAGDMIIRRRLSCLEPLLAEISSVMGVSVLGVGGVSRVSPRRLGYSPRRVNSLRHVRTIVVMFCTELQELQPSAYPPGALGGRARQRRRRRPARRSGPAHREPRRQRLPRARWRAYTPRGGILEGITRETVFEIAAQLGYPRRGARSDPVRSLHRRRSVPLQHRRRHLPRRRGGRAAGRVRPSRVNHAQGPRTLLAATHQRPDVTPVLA